MMLSRMVRVVAAALIGLIPFVGLAANQNTPENECTRTAQSQVYSNAYYVEEAGDVVGYEMAFQQRKGNSIEALLYMYEGVPDEEGISISGQISGKKLTMKGKWIQHITEYPSGKEIVETRPVEVSGTLNSNRFRGTIKIWDNAAPVTLKRIDRIWVCRR
jgi:hypothetical protein